jgi:hypothetical protein
MGRFTDIRRGGELNRKLTRYTQYLQNPPAPRLNSRGDRDPSRLVYLNPFSIDIGTTEILEATANTEGYTLLSTFINGTSTGAEVAATRGDNTVKDVGRFRAAKVTVFQNATKTKTTPNSRFTGEPYLKYAGTTYSCPFGRKTATDDIQDAYRSIRAALKARTGLLVNRVSLQPERLYQS